MHLGPKIFMWLTLFETFALCGMELNPNISQGMSVQIGILREKSHSHNFLQYIVIIVLLLLIVVNLFLCLIYK